MIKKSILGVLVLLVLGAVAGVSPAFAVSPWWHLTSGSRPTDVRPGSARNEVQKLTVQATSEGYYLEEPIATIKGGFVEGVTYVHLPFNATAGEIELGLELLYGIGNVEVSNGGGPAEFLITFRGALADQPVGLVAEGEARITEVTAGQADGEIVVTAENTGDGNVNGEASPVRLKDILPPGLKAVAIRGSMPLPKGSLNGVAGLPCSLGSLTCTVDGSLVPYQSIEMWIPVVVEGASSGVVNQASVSGGEAPEVSVNRPVTIENAQTPFGIENYELTPEEEGGRIATQAGVHPFQLTTTLTPNHGTDTVRSAAEAGEPFVNPAALTKDVSFKWPSGLIGNPTVIPQCTLGQFLTILEQRENACPAQSAVGVAVVTVTDPSTFGTLTFAEPLFNLEPLVGEPARFGFFVTQGNAPVFIDTAVRTGSDYGITVNVDNITQAVEFVNSEVTVWGVPADPRHDNQRGWGCLALSRGVKIGARAPCNPIEASNPPPFLSLPTVCSGVLPTSVEADSWAEKGSFVGLTGSGLPALDGCNRLPFGPSIKVTPDGTAGSTPTGLTVDEHVPQDSTLVAKGLAESAVKGLSVTLPAGVGLNPAAADGLQACSESQIGLQNGQAPACPDASKVGTVKIKTPLLPDALEGAAYLATQNSNPFGSLVALYVAAEDPKAGVRVKAVGQVWEDPVTGQLTAHFEEDPLFEGQGVTSRFLPELAAEDIELHFFGGDRAPLSTPALCGAYTTTGTFTPWAENGITESSSTFNVTTGPNGTPCHNPLPFNPSLTAGTTSIQAGGFSPFTMTMSRPDGSQNLQAIRLKMPPGLLGTLATVKLCPEAQANAGTCGPESLIGHTIVSVGVGGDPYSVTGGQVFITEGYGGAPYGLSIVNPAKAGPFDLGKVVVRARIEVDRITAVLTVTTDTTGPYKIPTILDGIPLQIQHVNVSIDRPGFTFNPTNCSPLAITGSLTSDQGSVSNLNVPFQITNCAVLAFKPKLTAKTAGKTSRAKGASLSVKLTYPAGPYDANISKVKVDLPKQLPSRLTTLQKACPAKTFEANPASCPPASIVGQAKASTPVLPVPLSGPAYFVSHGGEEFPELIIVLQGYGTTVHLVGSTFISKAGVTSSTFKTIPDVPVGTFELTLPQGKFSALAANGNLCKSSLKMPTAFTAQNGAIVKQNTAIGVTGCSKHAVKKKMSRHRKKK